MAASEIQILIVDDEKPIRELLGIILGDYTCAKVSSADEAVELIGSEFYNLVIADVGLPGLSGIELCELVKRTSPRTVVLIISGNAESEVSERAIQKGALGFILKPFDISSVRALVEEALNHQAQNAA
jgi:DNA-binding NtrC family response regulator